jgi:hypothetical protein
MASSSFESERLLTDILPVKEVLQRHELQMLFLLNCGGELSIRTDAESMESIGGSGSLGVP